MRISRKILLMSVAGIVATSGILIAVGQWQSVLFSEKSSAEAAKLVDDDLNHTTIGALNMISAQGETVQQEVQNDLRLAHDFLNAAGGARTGNAAVQWQAINQFTKAAKTVQLPQMLVGSRWLGVNRDKNIETPIVDHVQRIAQCKATIFQRMNEQGDMLRVATNVLTTSGARAVGTFIPATNPTGAPNPVVAAVLSGKSYIGPAFIVNAWYISNYEPIKDPSGRVIGMLFAAVPQNGIASLNDAILATRIGKTGGLTIYGGLKNDEGRRIVSHFGQGQDAWDSKDAQGQPYIQKIIQAASSLKSGELASMRYLSQEEGEASPSMKLARIAYYAPWSWVIVSSAPEAEFQAFEAHLQSGRQQMMLILLIAGALISLLCGWIAQVVADRISNPLKQVSQALRALESHELKSLTHAIGQLEQGDLTSRLTVSAQPILVTTNDECGEITRSFNQMLASLDAAVESFGKAQSAFATLLGLTGRSSNTIAASAGEIADGNADLARRTSEQASNLEKTAASMEQMTFAVKQSAAHAVEANQLAEQARSVAVGSGVVVASAIESMNGINGSSRRIADIVTVIDEIAFQTNLLALNAAVEAARVGERGKGFAVVASEVRILASRSSKAAKEIKTLVNESVNQVSAGSELVHKSGERLNEIVRSVEQVTQIVSRIASTAQEQAAGIEQVNKAIGQLEEITQHNAALVEEASEASDSMRSQASDLQDIVGKFRFNDAHVAARNSQKHAA
ncbi:MAG: Cache 3/Cache 2 fusion domain-containing protein [Capsulimonadaceae bacterium]|nr:Cache 3/Cache 2 fusion domain-containing protein [Capsulimonadaceae bacterium]